MFAIVSHARFDFVSISGQSPMSQKTRFPPPRRPAPDGSVEAGWWHRTDDDRIVCDLCPRECHLKPGDRGFCFVRENRDGEMRLTTYGRSTGFCIDPIEKKPLNHFFPGTSVLSFGTAGCNLGCKFCQNWSISKSREVRQLSEIATPETIANAAEQHGCKSVAFTYNDPVIWAEYAIDTARACRQRGIKTVAVTAGYISEVARRPFYEQIDAANVDLKAFSEAFYQELTLSHLKPVLETLDWLHHETKVWVEITNLVIPQANDGDDEFRAMCDWLLDHVGDEVPLHFTAFHPDFRLKDRDATSLETLLRGYELATQAGVKYVYVGNVNDVQHQSTYCPSCKQMLIERDWHQLGRYNLKDNRCQACRQVVAGHFETTPGDWGRKRLPIRISEFATERSPLTRSDVGESQPPAGETQMNQPMADPPNGDVDRPELTKSQQQAIVRITSEIVRAAVMNCQPEVTEEMFAGAAEIPVFGCFVSIKRKQKLRGCCGFLGRRMPLVQALVGSAKTSATEDSRMPSVSPSELPFLDFEIWLLYGQQPITSQGNDRLQDIIIGKHGLQIEHGETRGLLLPGVASDHRLDPEGFLQQVCIKAGLPPTDWREDDAQLANFEGLLIEGPFQRDLLANESPKTTERFSKEELQALSSWCAQNICASCRGAVPTFYLPNISDSSIHGVNLEINLQGRSEPLRLSQMSLRQVVPLQATLFQMSETAGKQFELEGLSQITPRELSVAISLAYDPAMHGTLAEPDMDGFDPSQRALLVNQNSKSAWAFDPNLAVPQLLEQLAEKADITIPETASLSSYTAQANITPMWVVNVPRPAIGPQQRPPAVAGMFYPDNPDQLKAVVQDLIPTDHVPKRSWRAALVPHAGLMFSGKVAADVLRRIEFPPTIIVIGPKHTGLGVEWAVAPHDSWQIPGGNIPSDPELAQQLCDSIEGLQLDAIAHLREHAIEVELPFLAQFAPQSKVVGIAIGEANFEHCQRISQGLARVLEDRLEETLLIISSDMNHYASDDETRRVDELALRALEGLDPQQLFHTVRDNNISMCGMLPACIVLDSLRRLNCLRRAERVGYATSADVSNDKSRVVGYAGMLFE